MIKRSKKFWTCISIISIRITNLNIHYLVGATYYKVLLFITFLGLFLIFPSLFNSSEYSISDVIYLNVAGFFHFWALIFQAASYHYWEISKVTVMNYFSGIFAFIIDLLVFKYDFTTTDIIGMLIVILFLFAPALYQMKNKMVHK